MNLEYINFEKLQKSTKIIDNILIKNLKAELDKNDYSDEIDYIFSDIILKLLNGSDNINKNQINKIIEMLPEKLKGIIKNRLFGLIESLDNNYGEAINYLEKALKEGKEKNIKKWIIRDIFIDIRNLIIKQHSLNNEKYSNDKLEEIQDNIKELTLNNFYPILDRELYNAFDNFNEEMFNLNTDNPYTNRFSSIISNSMDNINKALIVAIIYGSNTFIHFIRERLADLLYHYSNLHNSSELHYKSLKLFVLENKFKKVEKVLNSDWDILYDEIIDSPLNIIEFPVRYKETLQKRSLKCLFIEKLGQYLSRNVLDDIQSFLIDCLDMSYNLDKKYDVKRNSLRAIKNIVNRLDTNLIIEKVLNMLDENRLIDDKIIQIFVNVNWHNVNEDLTKKVLNKIYDLRNDNLSVYNLYVIMYHIKNTYPEMVKEKENKLLSEWKETSSLDISWYFGQKQYPFQFDNNNLFINDLINRLDEKNENEVIEFGGYSLYHLLGDHLINNKLNNKSDEIFGVFNKVLTNQNQIIKNKIQCIESTIRIFKSDIKELKLLGEKVNNLIQEKKDQVLECKINQFINKSNYERLELKIMNLFVNVDSPEEIESIIAKCIEYGNHSFIDVRLDSLKVTVFVK